MRDDLAEILFQSFPQEALVSSSGVGRDVHSLILSIQHFLCRSRRCPPSKVPRRMAFERLSWRVTCLNLVRFRLDRCHKKILWTHREVHLAPHPVVRLVLGFKSLALFFFFTFLSLFIFCGHSTREPASGRVTYFILLAYTGTGVSRG